MIGPCGCWCLYVLIFCLSFKFQPVLNTTRAAVEEEEEGRQRNDSEEQRARPSGFSFSATSLFRVSCPCLYETSSKAVEWLVAYFIITRSLPPTKSVHAPLFCTIIRKKRQDGSCTISLATEFLNWRSRKVIIWLLGIQKILFQPSKSHPIRPVSDVWSPGNDRLSHLSPRDYAFGTPWGPPWVPEGRRPISRGPGTPKEARGASQIHNHEGWGGIIT